MQFSEGKPVLTMRGDVASHARGPKEADIVSRPSSCDVVARSRPARDACDCVDSASMPRRHRQLQTDRDRPLAVLLGLRLRPYYMSGAQSPRGFRDPFHHHSSILPRSSTLGCPQHCCRYLSICTSAMFTMRHSFSTELRSWKVLRQERSRRSCC